MECYQINTVDMALFSPLHPASLPLMVLLCFSFFWMTKKKANVRLLDILMSYSLLSTREVSLKKNFNESMVGYMYWSHLTYHLPIKKIAFKCLWSWWKWKRKKTFPFLMSCWKNDNSQKSILNELLKINII